MSVEAWEADPPPALTTTQIEAAWRPLDDRTTIFGLHAAIYHRLPHIDVWLRGDVIEALRPVIVEAETPRILKEAQDRIYEQVRLMAAGPR